MLRSSRFILSIVIFLVLGVQFAFGQEKGTIRGVVTDKASGEPLPAANIVVVGTMMGTTTDADGAFILEVPAGEYTLRVSYIGYDIVVVGSRAERTAVETPVPVDVIPEVELRESPQFELNQVLRDVVPSYNASHQTISDGTDHINPASLRGLGPDQVLVLINGKRRHPSALVHVNGTFGRGTVGIDLNAIPKAAIERVEVLRDGAAAQYGSDAIAGVINIVLKQATGKIQMHAMTGANNLLFKRPITMSADIQALRQQFGLSPNVEYNEADGETFTFDVNYGFKIGTHGFFNITAEYMDRGRTPGPAKFSMMVLRQSPNTGMAKPGPSCRMNRNWLNAV